MFPPDSHWELQFKPYKGPKSEENDPRYQKAGYLRAVVFLHTD